MEIIPGCAATVPCPSCPDNSLVSRYCAARFACRTPTWQLPVPGCVVDLVAAHDGAGREDLADGVRQEVCWVRSSGPGRKRIRLNRKTPAHFAGLMVRSRPRVWKRLRLVETICVSLPDPKRRRCYQEDQVYVHAQDRAGVC